MKITRRSAFTGKVRTLDLDVTSGELTAWERGKHIQAAMPRLKAIEREFIMTGVTKEEWDDVFQNTDD